MLIRQGKGEFFAVDRRIWAMVCERGMNAAVAYLIQARGTGRDQRTTHWSAAAIETYTGTSRLRARAAIKDLQLAGLTRVLRGGTHPRYDLLSWAEIRGERLRGRLTSAHLRVLDAVARGDQPNSSKGKTVSDLLRLGLLEKADDEAIRIPDPEWIWLPNAFVTGATAETPPLELLRQSQDVMALRLAIDLYFSQNLREDSGICRLTVVQ
jgi:hypothetical protein